MHMGSHTFLPGVPMDIDRAESPPPRRRLGFLLSLFPLWILLLLAGLAGGVAGLVPCGKKQRDGLAPELLDQAADRRLRRRLFELGIISGPEFLPTSWIAMEAATKRSAWGDFF